MNSSSNIHRSPSTPGKGRKLEFSENSTSETSLRSHDALISFGKSHPQKKQTPGRITAKPAQVTILPNVDPRKASDLAAIQASWKSAGEQSPADDALSYLYDELHKHPDRSLSDEEIAFCTPTDQALELINPHAMSVGMQVSSALAGGTTAYLVSFGASELLTASVRASGTPLPVWGHGLLAGALHAVFAEVFGSALRGNRGTYASPANKAFDTQLKAFCDGIEAAWAHGHAVNYAPLKELLSQHMGPHMLSDELAFSPFAVSGAVSAYLNKTLLEKLISPTHQRGAFEIGAAAVRIVLGAFVGGFGTAGLQHATRSVIQGSPPPAPGVAHRPERRAYMQWQYQTALTQRLAVLELGLVNLRARLASVLNRDAQQPIVHQIGRLQDAITGLEGRLKANESKLQTELVKMDDTDEPLTVAKTTQLDVSGVRTQLANKVKDWSATRSTIATAIANSTAAAFGLLLPAIGVAQTLTPIGNQTVADPYIQPMNDVTANGLIPVSMIMAWMLMRRPLKMVVEMGMASVAGMAKRATTQGSESFPPQSTQGAGTVDNVVTVPIGIADADGGPSESFVSASDDEFRVSIDDNDSPSPDSSADPSSISSSRSSNSNRS